MFLRGNNSNFRIRNCSERKMMLRELKWVLHIPQPMRRFRTRVRFPSTPDSTNARKLQGSHSLDSPAPHGYITMLTPSHCSFRISYFFHNTSRPTQNSISLRQFISASNPQFLMQTHFQVTSTTKAKYVELLFSFPTTHKFYSSTQVQIQRKKKCLP